MKLIRSLALLTLVATVGGMARRHRKVALVAPDLRVPALYAPMSLSGPRSLQAGRSMMRPTAVRDGVVARDERVGPDATRVVVYEPAGRSRPSGALVWIHGGGLVMGSADTDHDLCSLVAAELGILVVSVDYRLAPEHPFPLGLDDCEAALEWVHHRAADLGVDPTRIAVGGSSAGGGLAACVAQIAHDRGGLPLALQLLLYPMLDDRTALRTDPAAADAIVWTNRSNRYSWGAYLGHPPAEHEARRYASAARRDDLSGLAPAWIGIGDVDLFHDEDVEYARRLTEVGVPCDLVVVPGMYHAADLMKPDHPAMRDLRRRLLDALRAAVGTTATAAA